MIKSVAKALHILEIMSRAPGPMRLRDIAEQSDMTRSNAFRMLQSLQELGFVRQLDSSTQYDLTLKAFEIGARVLNRNSLVSIAHPILVELSERVPHNIILSMRDGLFSVVVDRIESRAFVRTFAFVGARAPLHLTSGGKVLLAFAGPEVIAAACANLVRMTERTITDPKRMEEQIATIREQGFATAIGEVNDVVKGIAVPVRSRHGDVVAALSISGPMEQLAPGLIETYFGYLRDHATRIEAAWPDGYRQFSGDERVPRPSSA